MTQWACGCAKRRLRRSECWQRSGPEIPRRRRWRSRAAAILPRRQRSASTADHCGSRARGRSGTRMILRDGRAKMKHKLHRGDAEARSFRSSTKIHSAAVLMLLLLISVPCVSGEQPSTVEFSALVANPIQFHGKLIEVKGFLVQRFENSALYADRKWQ